MKTTFTFISNSTIRANAHTGFNNVSAKIAQDVHLVAVMLGIDVLTQYLLFVYIIMIILILCIKGNCYILR